jgi:secretion/DNA translocation related CpaE-like protein
MPANASDRRPLVISADEELLDDLVRLAAVTGVVLDVAADAGAGLRRWAMAPLALVGADVVAAVAAADPPRRPDVVVVGRGLDASLLWESALALGAEQVLSLPDDEQRVVARISAGSDAATPRAVTVGVVGGRGGAGASTLAAALAVTATRRRCTAFLVDADPLGGGIDLVLGLEDRVGMRWPDLAATAGRVSPVALRSALPTAGDLVVLSWDRSDLLAVPAAAMGSVLRAAQRAADVVVVDLPRHREPATTEALSRCTTVLLVLPAEVRAVGAASRVACLVSDTAADVRVVVRGPSPAGLDGRTIADALGLPLAGELAAEPRLGALLEHGKPPAGRGKGPLAAFCRSILADLGVRPGGAGVAA